MSVHINFSLQNHPIFHSEKRLVSLHNTGKRKRVLSCSISIDYGHGLREEGGGGNHLPFRTLHVKFLRACQSQSTDGCDTSQLILLS